MQPTENESESSLAPGTGKFAVTRWSVVLAAGKSESTHARAALEELCRAYWQPIYAFVRRQGHSPHDAQDLTQEFFARLLEKKYLETVDPAKGRFRSFLLASLKHFLANEWDKARALKRGGGQVLLAIEAHSAETAYALEPVEHLNPDKLFERRWALALLHSVMARLREDYVRGGKTELFEQLKTTLTGERRSLPYADIGAALHTSEGAIKVAVHRLRQRYRELLRDEIERTVASPAEVDEEIRALFGALEN
ncbi:MAG: sigma-70 family RNA polymerase sigma factor [Chloroflexi bacterium]|nr:MAG: sigma-70 family RNA polymerase sigma factor [Chloroflexota bacterium]